jgi:hypothetical protein
MMRSPITWFVLLASVCLAGPYLLGTRPRSRRDWTYIALTLAFLAWLLPLMIAVRSR